MKLFLEFKSRSTPGPALVFYHGGGWVFGSLSKFFSYLKVFFAFVVLFFFFFMSRTMTYHIYSGIMHIKLFVGIFSTKCCALYSNKYDVCFFKIYFK